MKLEPAQSRGEITLRLFFDIARKRLALISAVWLWTVLGVAFVTFFVLTPIFQSTAVVLVKLGREFVYNAELGDRKAFLRSMDGIILAELEILHSDDLLREVVSTLGPDRLYPDLERDDVPHPLYVAVQRFRQDFSATAVSMTDVIRISFRHADPEIAANSVNVLVDHFKDAHLRAFGEPQSTAFLQEKVARFQQELEESEEKLREFQAKHPILTVVSAGQTLEEQRVQIDAALKEVRNERAALEERGAFLKEKQESLSPYSYSDSLLERALDHQILSVAAEQRAQVMRQRGLERQLAAATADLKVLPSHLNTYRALLRERDANARIYQIYSRRIEEALISEEMDSKKIANISVIQNGRPALLPSSPNKLLNLAVGAILGLGLGFGLALLLEGLETEEAEVGAEVSELLLLRPGLPRTAEVKEWEWVPLKQSAEPPSKAGY
jgi:uncharacterized protein involved in exopolysaccharide biosynthesis